MIRIDNSALKVHLKTRDGKRTSTYQDFFDNKIEKKC